MKLTIELPEDLAERFAAAGIAPEEAPNFAVALMREALQAAGPDEDTYVSAEEEAELRDGTLRGLQAEAEGRYRPLSEYLADFEKRHGFHPLRQERTAA